MPAAVVYPYMCIPVGRAVSRDDVRMPTYVYTYITCRRIFHPLLGNILALQERTCGYKVPSTLIARACNQPSPAFGYTLYVYPQHPTQTTKRQSRRSPTPPVHLSHLAVLTDVT